MQLIGYAEKGLRLWYLSNIIDEVFAKDFLLFGFIEKRHVGGVVKAVELFAQGVLFELNLASSGRFFVLNVAIAQYVL